MTPTQWGDGFGAKICELAHLGVEGWRSVGCARSLCVVTLFCDVVQAYAGGIRLETLFIDEGFGSLDSDTLDLAIKTLIDLRNTGRMVGIISHVSELKEQITMRLDVISGRQGSKIQLVY